MHADIQLAPQLQEAIKRRRRWAVLGVVLAILGGVLLVEFRTLYGMVKGWRARGLAEKAEDDIRNERWQEAMTHSQAAYQLKPDEPAAIRLAARLHGMSGKPWKAIVFWKQLIASKGSIPADRLGYAGDLLRAGAVSDAGREIETLLRDQPDDAAALRLAAQWSVAEGNGDGARDFAARANQKDPANHEGRLLLGLLQATSGNPGLRDTGLKGLLELGHERSREALEALRRLAMHRDTSPEAVDEIAKLLRAHPAAMPEDRLLALGLEIMRTPADRGALLDKEVAHYKDAAPGEKRLFGAWLNSKGEHARMLTLLPKEEALTRKDLLLVYLDGIAALKRWVDIQRILEMSNAPLDLAYRELFLARAAMELGDPTRAELHWRRAHIAAAPSPEQMNFIAAYAEKVGQWDRAESAYRSLAASAVTARPAYEALLRIAEKRRDMDALREVLREMRERWPKDSSVANDYAYVCLLQGRQLKESFETARKLVAQSPGSFPHRTTLALAGYRLGDKAMALSVYEGLRIPWERVGAGPRAVYAAVLGANGRKEEAAAEANAVRWEDLRREEQELIKPWRKQ